MTDRVLADFRGLGYSKGRSLAWQAAWFAMQNLVFRAWWCPPAWRPRILRVFGAQVGQGVFIRHDVRVLWPWKLTIGGDTWIGESAWILNLEEVRLGRNVCVSQGAFLCTGGHDRNSPTFEYQNGQVVLEDSAWVGAMAIIMPGVTVGNGATVAAGTVVRRDVPSHDVVR